ncbi:hypothetical protein AMTR_s00108p00153640, partial [Amborella trichopoda]
MFQAKSSLEVAIDLFNSKIVIKAMDHLDKVVIVFSPECSKAKLLKIKILIAEKDYSGAIAETGYILKSDESNLEALLLRGQAYYYLVDHDVALRHYQKGLRLDPEHSGLKKAYFGLKNLIKKTKSMVAEFKSAKHVLELTGWFICFPHAEENLAKGKLRLAVEDFKGALALDPNHTAYNVHLYLELCKVLIKLARGKDALDSCTAALDIDGELIDALVQ